MTRPNILYLHSHDTGRYIQPYGHAVPTPNMQKLAEEGVLFRKAFCAGPTCSPSRAALLTGASPHSCGMTGLAHRGWSLNDYSRHIIHTLRRHGYTSALAGVQHIAQRAETIGYDRILELKDHRAETVAPAAAEWLKSGPPEPFFLSVGFTHTHREFPEPSADNDPRYTLPPAPLPDTPRTRCDMAAFKTAARAYDDAVGTVLEALQACGLAADTLVASTTDHGIAFPGMKCRLTDHGIGVMLIVRGPGGFEGGKVIDGLVSQIDLFPTLCELLEIEPPPWLEGVSIMPLVRGRAEEVNKQIFAEVTWHAAYEPMRCVRTRRWKYIRRFDGRNRPVLPNCDQSPSKDVWLEAGWRQRPVPEEQLYDLIFDPNETNNLVADAAHGRILEEMRGRLETWMKATADPLLAGPVPAPKGARANDPNGLSPQEECMVL